MVGRPRGLYILALGKQLIYADNGYGVRRHSRKENEGRTGD